jgi:hypothetical protein
MFMSEPKIEEEQKYGHDLANNNTVRNLSNSSYLVNDGKLTPKGEVFLDSFLKNPQADITNLSPVMQKEAEKKLKGKQ